MILVFSVKEHAESKKSALD